MVVVTKDYREPYVVYRNVKKITTSEEQKELKYLHFDKGYTIPIIDIISVKEED